MINTVDEMQRLLFHIHSMSELLTNHHRDLTDREKLTHDPDDNISEPLLTIADIIKEKTESCLKKLELLEVHFWEKENAAKTDSVIIQ